MNRVSKKDTGAWNIPKGMDKGLWFVPLGGAGEIGMNMNLFACDGRWLMVDCGITFGDDTVPGIDVVMPDPSFIAERCAQLDGLVITHAHEDHLGAVSYLWPQLKCPVYATPFAAEFLKNKLAETGLTDEVTVHVLPLSGRAQIGPFDIEFVTLTHSIPEPNAVVIRTRYGAIFHTGDWKFDPDPLVGEASDFKKLEALGREDILALIGDSTNVFTEGEAGSERGVRDNLISLFARYTGRIAVGCFASNVARLESIAHAAEVNGRHVALVGQSLWRIVETSRKTGYLSPNMRFYEAEEASHLPRDKVLYICTGSQGEGRAALMRIAFDQHPDVVLEEGDVVIFSSRVIPGNEQAVHKVQNQLIRTGVDIVTWRDEHIHVSGHPARDELRRMYGLIRPRIAIPVHGELMHMNAHAKLAKECQVPQAVLVENGAALKFTDGTAEVMGNVWSGRLALLDGRTVALTDPLIKERKKLLFEGAVVVSVVLDDQGLADDPQVTMLGLTDPLENPNRRVAQDRDWDWIISNAVERLPKKARRDDAVIEDAVKTAVRKVFAPTGRKPLVKVHISLV